MHGRSIYFIIYQANEYGKHVVELQVAIFTSMTIVVSLKNGKVIITVTSKAEYKQILVPVAQLAFGNI